MSYLINNQQKMNEIIFAERNKAYGAYTIRSDYGYTVLKSLSFMMLGVGSIVMTAFLMNQNDDKGSDLGGQLSFVDSVFVIPFGETDKSEEKKTEKSKPDKALPADPNTDNPNKRIVDSTEITQTSTATSTSGETVTTTEPAEGSGGTDSGATQGSQGSSLGTDTAVKQYLFVDSPPEFEGGLPALYRFVSQNLKYPERALDEGKGGTVYVKFVVDENGKVGRLSLLNSAGYGMDDEALRVVSIIPNFKSPAKSAGKAVKVYYQLPIRFRYKY